jgi:muramoyltetrapeptide carboxypeptidase
MAPAPELRPGSWPARLCRGDRVAVIAPSGPVDSVRLARGVRWLRGGLGLDVVVGRHVLDRGGHGLPFLAGADRDRAADLQEAWLDPRVAAVLCARGGAGAPRLPDLLDWAAMAAVPPKVLCGLSDVTGLHLAVGRRLDTVSFYGPMVATAVIAGQRPDAASRAHLAAALLRPGAAGWVGGRGVRTLVPGIASGVTTGGCLSLLAAAAGSPDLVPATGGIALLEDLDEPPYRVERMLTTLLGAGWFAGVAAVACGDFVSCGDEAELAAVLLDRLRPLGVPVVAGLPFGHGTTQLTVPLRARATLDTSRGTLVFDRPPA